MTRTTTSNCPLCHNQAHRFCVIEQKNYFECDRCKSLFLERSSYPSKTAEKRRYTYHQNNLKDRGYRRFVRPLIKAVKSNFGNNHLGLDYGCGQNPVLTTLLRKKGMQVEKYDPFFQDNSRVFKKTYDYIVCCEVVEHFHQPRKEFERLKTLLKPGGTLFCKTSMITPKIKSNFKTWWYKNDLTHVFFYSEKTFLQIKQQFNFAQLEVNPNYVLLHDTI